MLNLTNRAYCVIGNSIAMKPPTIARWLLLSALSLVPSVRAGMGFCSDTEECETGCCSSSGYCGFGPDFCGDDVCISTCDAVAECGKYAETPGTECPLNVCCSEFGFCGTTEEFCSGGCQSGCDAVNQPSCSGTSSEAIYIGYYEGWNPKRPCDVILPEDINVSPWTHLFYSFAGIDSSDFTITTTNANDEEYWSKFTALKQKKSSLKTYISVGGWDVGGKVFSDMVRFPGTRKSFIDSAIAMMKEYGFDGIDIDWEYPAAGDRGGAARDTANLVTFLSELRAAVGTDFGLTCTLPSSYWYLKGFDIVGMAGYVDFFNFMSYDIHGTWDGNSEWTDSVINPHTNLTEISAGLDLLWRNGIDPSKVLLGLGFYGRSFTLDDPSCANPGCNFYTDNNSTGGAVAGECTGTSGILSDYEISRIIDDYSVNINYDEAAGVNWMTWSSNQWVSFDNGRTLRQKADFANSKCLAGLFSWALDLGGPGSLKNPNDLSADDTSMTGANADGGSDGTGLLYVGEEVLRDSPTVTAVAPVSIIFPKSVLDKPTIIDFGGGYPTSLEVAWSVTETVTSNSITTVTATITRYIMETTIPLAPLTTGTINYYNWNISDIVTGSIGTLIPSIEISPVVITDHPNPLNQTGVTHSPLVTRTVSIPPWPWTTDGTTYPTVTFTQGDPPGPTCTANCGHKCYSFCDGPCLSDCGIESSSSFIDPLDQDAPSVSKCSGPGCVNGKCTGDDLCIERGCTGDDCKDRICVGDDCIPTACTGAGCEDGHCSGNDCQDHGCIGEDCDSTNTDEDDGEDDDNGGSGHCWGLRCLSWGCIGRDCSNINFTCSGPRCRIVTCSGRGCSNGVCSGEGCKSEDSDCESEEADTCTEYISSTLITPASTYSTTTVTSHCETITACAARPTTVTSTVDKDGLKEGTISNIESGTADDATLTSYLDEQMMSWYSAGFTTSTTTTTTTKTTTTTTTSPTPSETGYDCKGSIRCGTFANLHSFCDMAKAFLTETTVYGTKDSDYNPGTCYTDGKNAGYGCGVFVEGEDCEMTGDEMAAAYDHIFQETGGDCGICGHAFLSNGCTLTVNYVSGCKTSNGALEVFVGNASDVWTTTASSSTLLMSSSPESSAPVKLY
ncbi:bacteriodes thetaiotaomicron symbiotic chitinase [Aspergillus floccosus]